MSNCFQLASDFMIKVKDKYIRDDLMGTFASLNERTMNIAVGLITVLSQKGN